mgnify:CR=1 FL=1
MCHQNFVKFLNHTQHLSENNMISYDAPMRIRIIQTKIQGSLKIKDLQKAKIEFE